MPVDTALLQELCSRTLERTDFTGLGRRDEGKVRDSYIGEKRRTIVVSDRVSCFDVVVGTIPLKGQVLNQLAAFWFEKTRAIAPNHLIEVPDPNVSVVRELKVVPVEFVMRGYLTGVSSTSIWTAYERGERRYCGHDLPDGLSRHEPLPEPLLTPTTKAEQGEHDELTSREELIASGAISEERYDQAAAIAGRLFAMGQEFAASRGLILVDTKYEMGLDADGNIILIDEIFTPDSSRFWPADQYATGKNQPSYDKQILRDWLETLDWDKNPPGPDLPEDLVARMSKRYAEVQTKITGQTAR